MSSVKLLFDDAATNRRHGASEIERRLIDALLRQRRHWDVEVLAAGAQRLLEGQPAMANLRGLAKSIADDDLVAVEHRLQRRAAALAEAGGRMADAAWPWIDGSERVLTISCSSAVAAVITGAWRRGWRGETVVFDGGPTGRGSAQARLLTAAMIGVSSQPDAAVVRWLGGPTTRVVIGADAVGQTRLINACGTGALLELARSRSIPTIVVADSGKDLADDELDEMLACGQIGEEPGVGRRWPVFEAVALALVTSRVRE